MQLFFLENPNDEIVLSTDESKHISKVLRKKTKDILNFTDGKGNLFIGEITNSKEKNIQVKIINKEVKEKQHDYYLHIAIAPPKNIDRFEWFLEKATEIGIDEITPIICERSERIIIKKERGKRILVSAIKQSLKYHLPKLNETIKFNDFINQEFIGSKYMAHCNYRQKKIELKKIKNIKKTLILIGPEGDFTGTEIKTALGNQFNSISLGESRLRTETAGIIATHTINIK